MIQLEIANINLLGRTKKGQVNFMKKKITAILMVILIGIMAAGCGQQQKTEQTAGTEESASQDIFAMDTYMSVTAYGADAESAVSDAIAEIERLDALLSTVQTILRADKLLIERVFDYAHAGEIAVIRKYGQLLEERYQEDGIYVKAYIPKDIYARLSF